jgi:putative ABC transport system permease protein
MVVWKIALRNLKEHKVKTIIIGTLIAIAITLLVLGNSFMDSVTAGMERTYSETYTADLIVHAPTDPGISLFGAIGPSAANSTLPQIDDLDSLVDILNQKNLNWTPLATGIGTIAYQEEIASMGLFWGIDESKHKEVFPSALTIQAGRWLLPGEEGVVLGVGRKEAIEDAMDTNLHVGEKLIVTGFSGAAGPKIRELEIVGFFQYERSNTFLDMVSFVDNKAITAIAGLGVSKVQIEDLSAEEQDSLGEVNEEDFFGAEDFGLDFIVEEAPLVDNSDFTLDVSGLSENYSPNWHFLLIDTASEQEAAVVKAELEGLFAANDRNLVVDDWRWGAGMSAEIAFSLQFVLNIVILIISVVAIIIIMNTLVISVTERIGEIGTIRAIGGQKGFIRSLITWETLATTGLFGLGGILLAGLILAVLNIVGLSTTDEFLQILIGGEVFRPFLSLPSVAWSLFAVAGIGLVSSLYPVSLAMKVPPVVAMRG